MKRIMMMLAIVLVWSPAYASENTGANCKAIGDMARNIMKIRQDGAISKEDLTKVMSSSNIDKNQLSLVTQMVDIAYSKSAIEDEKARLKWIAKFGYTMEDTCYDRM